MKIIPVMDILDNKVVHGVKGERNKYKPITNSQITNSSDPSIVANDFRTKLNLNLFYIADLDLIQRTGKQNTDILEKLTDNEFELMVDGGFRNYNDFKRINHEKINYLIIGTETIDSFGALIETVQKIGKEKVIVSIDLKGGKLLANSAELSEFSPIQLAKKIDEMGIFAIIVLELLRVGSEEGTLNETLINIRKVVKKTKLFTGGGVRNFEDLILLHKNNIDGVLIATALHKGNISKKEINEIQSEKQF